MQILAFVNPVLFKLGPLEVRWYGLIVVSAILTAIWVTERNAKSRGLDAELVPDLALWVVPAGIIGARLYECLILQWPYYSQHLIEIPQIWLGGLAIHGGVLGGGLAAAIIMLRRKQPFWAWADCIAPGLILAQAIGRWGNFFNQEAYGSAAPDWLINLMPGWLKDGMTISGTVMHPTFLYESVWNLLVAVVLMAYFRRNRARGTTFALYLILYDLGRFVIESIREDSSFIFGTIRTAQFTAVVLALIGVVLFAFFARRSKPVQEQPE
ncbi:MAG TPA: prolipoprotein diacylglyceryl transferase [Symbiobacteriaceae bacterium]|nr:prolipoprotein diacylglyceryl transferase [Symbiobacteriaceae bacterium]